VLRVASLLGYRIVEVPVNWTDIPGSKVNVLRHSWRIFWDIFRVRYLTPGSLTLMDVTKVPGTVTENALATGKAFGSKGIDALVSWEPGMNPELAKIERVNILGYPVTRLSIDGFVAQIEKFIRSRKPHYIVMVNAAKLVKMRSDKELEESVLAADLIGADGVPVVWASRLFGIPLPGRVNGTDLMYELLKKGDEKRYRIFFFGAQQQVLDQVLDVVRKDYPGVQIAGAHHGYFAPQEEPAIVDEIRESQADILFIAFGTPKKELWVKRYLHAMEVPVIHGVGGSFDVLARVISRAPLWMQRHGLEWFFRLLQEPRRMWRRYLVTNTLFILLVLREWLRYQPGLVIPKIRDR
jgi:N-acetylglucosaminyldiphosphoundecaprenol N-acetyl-beta-D-mannosaminyltransferase